MEAKILLNFFLKKSAVAFAFAAFLLAGFSALLGGLSLETIGLRALAAGAAFGIFWALVALAISKIF